MLHFLTIAALATLAAGAPVGEIFGDVRLGDKYLADAQVQLKCGEEVAKAKTDSSGSFRLSVKGTGKCALSITHQNQTPSIDVVVFDKPARYRLVLELKDGAYVVKRV
jgi:hypothetical protein